MIDLPMQLYIGLAGCKMGLEIIGAGLQHRASKKAASAQKEAAYEANQTARDLSAEQMDLYKQIYDEQKAQQAPYLKKNQSFLKVK